MIEKVIEKQIIYKEVVDAIEDISFSHDLFYQQNEKGMQTSGYLYVNGKILIQGLYETFQDAIALNILAPSHKLCDEMFHIDVQKIEGICNTQGVMLYITLEIFGICDEEKKKEIKENKEDEGIEDFFKDEDPTYICSKMVVVKENDTYASIADRYQVNESVLREINHHKELEAKRLVLLP